MNILKPFKKVSVVIVTYNGAQWIGNCVSSLTESLYPIDIIVVDNGSSDETTTLIRQKYTQVQLISNQRNLGFGGANNIGIKHALKNGADFVFLLNQDTTIQPDTLNDLLDIFSRNDDFMVLSPLHYNDDGSLLDDGFMRYLKAGLKKELYDDFIKCDRKMILEVPFINAAAWLMRKEVFRKVGGFAPLFFHYGEDRDFINRLHYIGLKFGVTNSSSIRHYRSKRNMIVEAWTIEKKTKYYYVGWLTRAADVNKNILSANISGLVWVSKETVVSVAKGNLNGLIVFLKVAAKIFSNIAAISEHRRMVKGSETYKFLECASE